MKHNRLFYRCPWCDFSSKFGYRYDIFKHMIADCRSRRRPKTIIGEAGQLLYSPKQQSVDEQAMSKAWEDEKKPEKSEKVVKVVKAVKAPPRRVAKVPAKMTPPKAKKVNSRQSKVSSTTDSNVRMDCGPCVLREAIRESINHLQMALGLFGQHHPQHV